MGSHVADVLPLGGSPDARLSDATLRCANDRRKEFWTTATARLAALREMTATVKMPVERPESRLLTMPGLLHLSSRFYGTYRIARVPAHRSQLRMVN